MRTEWWKPGIFDFHTDETAGERFRYRLLELVVAGWTCWFSWSWGFYILRIETEVLPLGYGSAAVCKLVASGPGWVDGVHLHLGVTGVMGIRFDAFVFILLLLWTPVPALLERVRLAVSVSGQRPPPAAA